MRRGEKCLGVLKDDMAAAIRKHVVDARTEALVCCFDHERLNLDRIQPLHRRTGKKTMCCQAGAESYIRDACSSWMHTQRNRRHEYLGNFIQGEGSGPHLQTRVGLTVGGNVDLAVV